MGDVSIIARRLSDKYVQHGWSGNGGYFKTVGERLLAWYDDPDMVEYLFGLGQLRHLWKPHSEKSRVILKTEPDGTPHWVSPSERWIFSKIAFIDYGYFYDLDRVWYYVVPGPFRIKIPATLVEANLDEESFEFSFLTEVEGMVLDEIFNERHRNCLEHSGYAEETLRQVKEELKQEEGGGLYELWEQHRRIFNCFDDWVVVRADESGEHVGEILMRPKEEKHSETIFW